MKNLIKISNGQFFTILLFKFLTRILSGYFSAFMFIVFHDMYGFTAGILAFIVGLITSSKGAFQLEFLFNSNMIAHLARKSGVDLEEIKKNNEDVLVQIGNLEPVKLNLIVENKDKT